MLGLTKPQPIPPARSEYCVFALRVSAASCRCQTRCFYAVNQRLYPDDVDMQQDDARGEACTNIAQKLYKPNLPPWGRWQENPTDEVFQNLN